MIIGAFECYVSPPDGTMTSEYSTGDGARSFKGTFYSLESQLSTRTEACLGWASTSRTRRGAAGPGEAGGEEAGDGDLRPGFLFHAGVQIYS